MIPTPIDSGSEGARTLHEAELDRRAGHQVRRLILLCLGLGLPYFLLDTLVAGPGPYTLSSACASVGVLVALWLARIGRFRAAAVLAAISLSLSAMLSAIVSGTMLAYPALLPTFALSLVFPCLVLGWREVVGTAAIQCVSLLGMGLAPTPPADLVLVDGPLRVAVFGVVYLCLLGSFLAGATHTYRLTIGQLLAQTRALERARDFLDASETRVQQLVEEMPDGLLTLDAGGTVAGCNPAAARLCGLSAEAIIGRHRGEIEPVQQLTQRLGLFDADVNSSHPELAETSFLRGDDRRVHVEAHARVVRQSGGGRVQIVLRDVSARIEANEAQAALEHELREARRLESVGRLAGGIAHDFNNLLTVIVSGADLLRTAELDASSRELVDQVDTAAQRAAELTGQLLAFARRQVRTPQVVDLNVAVGEFTSLLPRLVREDIELEIATAGSQLPVWADPTQLQQILMNLVINARDAMPTGGALTVRTAEARVDAGDTVTHEGVEVGLYARLSVSDTGQGMDKMTREHAFEPFFSTKGVHGTGLGLATVHGLVKQSGGHVVVESLVGEGTTFEVYLPITNKLTASKPAPVQQRTGGDELTVLVVDDEFLVLRTMQRVLQSDGFTVLIGSSPAEALRLSKSHPGTIDVLLTDVVMPQMGGPELAELLQRSRPGLRVLFTSGYNESTVVRRGILERGIHFLAKPFTPEGLLGKLAEVLSA